MSNESRVLNQPNLTDAEVIVYGTCWCAATQFVRRFLDRAHVAHTFRDIDQDPEAATQVKFWTGGFLSHPTVKIGGDILVEPFSNELLSSLLRHGLIKE